MKNLDLKEALSKYSAINIYKEYRESELLIYRQTNTYTIVNENEYGEIILKTDDGSSVCIISSSISYTITQHRHNRDIIILYLPSGEQIKLSCKKNFS